MSGVEKNLSASAFSSPGRGFPGSHLCERLLDARARSALRRQFLHRPHAQHRAPARQPALRAAAPRRHVSRSMSRSTRSTTSPARPRRCTTSSTRCRRPRPASSARSTCSASPSGVKARIFQASTSEVYGDPQVHPQPESYWGHVNPIGPRSCYDEGKRCAETLFFDYHRQHKRRHQGRAHLQHLRPAHAPQRRPRRLQLHRAGAARARTSPSTATARRRARSATSTT